MWIELDRDEMTRTEGGVGQPWYVMVGDLFPGTFGPKVYAFWRTKVN